MFSVKTSINIAIIVLVALIIYFGYTLYFGQSNNNAGGDAAVSVESAPAATDPATGETGGATGEASPAAVVTNTGDSAAEFVQILNSLNNVTLESNIFNNQIFASKLQDFSEPLPMRFAGRMNPFAPWGQAELAAGAGVNNNIMLSSALAPVATTSSTTAAKATAPAKAPAKKPAVAPKKVQSAPKPKVEEDTPAEEEDLSGDEFVDQ